MTNFFATLTAADAATLLTFLSICALTIITFTAIVICTTITDRSTTATLKAQIAAWNIEQTGGLGAVFASTPPHWNSSN